MIAKINSILMNQNKPQIDKAVVKCWIILGITLGVGGMFYTSISIFAIYLLLTHIRSDADFELLTVASVFGGIAVVQAFQMLILHPSLYSLDRILEPVGVLVLAITLLIIQKRALAWFLIIYSAIVGVLLLISALLHIPKEARPLFQLANGVINFVLVGLLIRWLRKPTVKKDNAVNSINKCINTTIPIEIVFELSLDFAKTIR